MAQLKSAKEIIFEQINIANSTNLNPNEFDISEPAVYSDNKNCNTVIRITPKSGLNNYFGSKNIYYNRTNIETLISDRVIDNLPQVSTTLYSLLPLINNYYNLNLTTDDVINTTIPGIDDSNPYAERTFIILIKPTSLLYTGVCEITYRPVSNVIIDTDNVSRRFFIYVDGLPEAKERFKCLNHYGEPLSDFNFLFNVSTIADFTVTNIERYKRDYFILSGNFTLSYTLNNVKNNLRDCKDIIIDKTGQLISFFEQGIFSIKDYTIKECNTDSKMSNNKVYFVSSNPALRQSQLYSCNLDIINVNTPCEIDTTFNPVIDYVPVKIKELINGKLITVSDVFEGGDPFNNNILTKMYRVDCLLENGQYDPDFNTIYIRDSSVNTVNVLIEDIETDEQDNLYLLFGYNKDISIHSSIPVINGKQLAQKDPLIQTVYCWNPIVKFKPNGEQVTGYNNVFKHYNPYMFPASGGFLNKIFPSTNRSTWLGYRLNTINGFSHYQFLNLDGQGKINNLSSANDCKWSSIISVKQLSNKNFVITGILQTIQSDDYYSAPYYAMIEFKPDGKFVRFIFKTEGPNPNSTPIVKRAFVLEQM